MVTLAIAILLQTAAAQQPGLGAFLRAVEDAPATELAALQQRGHAEFASVAGGRAAVDAVIELKRWELQGSATAAQRAEKLAAQARAAAPDDAWMHYIHALVLAHGPDVQSNGSVLRATGRSWAKELGFDARARARRSAERALELDSLHAPAAALYAELALQTLDEEELRRAEVQLQRAAAARPDAEAAAMLARLLTQKNDPAGALGWAERAVQADAASAYALHAHALALFRYPGRERQGAQQFFRALDRLTPALADRVFEEFRPIATPADTLRWAGTTLQQRGALLKGFWDVRAGLAGVAVAERMADHYQRLALALERYPRRTDGPRTERELITTRNNLPLDARGQIFVRHGAPWKTEVIPHVGKSTSACPELASWAQRGRLGSTTLGEAGGTRLGGMKTMEIYGPPAEVWAYQSEEGTRAFVFMRCYNLPDYYIPYTVPCDLVFPVALHVLSFDIHGCDNNTHERLRGWARTGLRTETHGPPPDRRIPMNFDLLSFRGSNGRTDLLAPIALLADSVSTTPSATGGQRYALRIGVTVVDTAAARVESRTDSVSFAPGQPLARGDRLNLHGMVSATPTRHAYLRILVSNPEHTGNAATHTEQIRVPAYVGDTLMISDLVLGAAVEGGNFQRGGRRIAVLPFARFSQGRFRTFYELYNLPANATHRTQILMHRMDARAQEVARVEFTEEAQPDNDGVVRVLRTLETELAPGRYRLTITVHVPGSRPVQKIRDFVVGS